MTELTHGQHVIDFVAQKLECSGFTPGATSLGMLRDGVLTVGIVYDLYNGHNIEMHIASDGSSRWMTRYFRWAAFDYPFNQLKVRRITTVTASDNTPCLRLNDKLGFRTEAILTGAHPRGDLIIKCMWRGECRYIAHEVTDDALQPRLAAA